MSARLALPALLLAGCDAADPVAPLPVDPPPVVLTVTEAAFEGGEGGAPLLRLEVENNGEDEVGFIRAGYSVAYVPPGSTTAGGGPAAVSYGEASPVLPRGTTLAPGASVSVAFRGVPVRIETVQCLTYFLEAGAGSGAEGEPDFDETYGLETFRQCES